MKTGVTMSYVVKQKVITKEELEKFTFFEQHVLLPFEIRFPKKIAERLGLEVGDEIELLAWNERGKAL